MSLQSILSGLFVALLIPQVSFSAEPSASQFESAFVLPWSYVKDSMTQVPIKTQITLNNLTVQAQGLEVQLPNAVLSLNLDLRAAEVSQQHTQLESDFLSVEVTTESFHFQKDIEKVIGGVVVRTHLEANCQPITIRQTQASALSSWSWIIQENRIGAELKDLQINWPQGSWQISPIQCEGPRGFADLIQNEIQSQLADPKKIENEVKSHLQTTVNQQLQQVIDHWRSLQWIYSKADRRIGFELTGVEALSEQGMLFYILIHIQGAGMSVTPHHLEISDETLSQVGAAPSLILSQDVFLALARVASQWARWDVELQDIPAFKSLMHSRFLQFFVWPDLMKYPKDSPFHMTVQAAQKPDIQWQGGSQFHVNALINSWIRSERDGKTWDYLFLQTSVSSVADLQVQDSQLQVNFSDLDMQSEYSFFPQYRIEFDPRKRIAKSKIMKALKSSPHLQSASLEIPHIQVTESQAIQAQGLRVLPSGIVLVDWH